MPWSGSAPNQTFGRDNGTHTGSTVWQQDDAAAVGIEADRHDTHDQDIATALNLALKKDGGNKPTALIDGGGFGFTNLGTLSSATEATVASATTTDVLGAAALFVSVTGTTTITSLGTGTKTIKIVRFTGTLTLTHNATSLILPTGANITTAAGDTMIVVSDGSSNARVLAYQKADGTPLTVTAASTTASGIVELAIASETTTGTDATRAVTPDGLAGSDYGKRVVSILVFDDATDCSTGNGAGDLFWRVPATLNGYNLVAVAACCKTAGTTGTMSIQIHNVTQAADMLSTLITIDSTETDSSTAATPAVIDTNNDDVATGDQIRIDVDAVHTTAAKGLLVEFDFPVAMSDVSFIRSAAKPAQVTFINSGVLTTDVTTYNFGDFTAATAGLMVVVVLSRDENTATASVDIGGSSADIVADSGTSPAWRGIATRAVSAGDHNVTVTFSSARDRCAVGVYLITGYKSATPHDTAVPAFDSSTTSVVMTQDIPVAGVAIYGAYHGANSNAFTWTNATEDFDTTAETPRVSSASLESAVALSAYDVTASWTGTSDGAGIGASWR